MAEPAYAFSIPSIEDDTPLDCRIYHPNSLHAILTDCQRGKNAIKGGIVAHPYPPLGGCYDDPVVLSVTETLLGQGHIVGTFNFRGASGSHGRSTLSGKAEQDDYLSFAGFMAYYLHNLSALESLNGRESSVQDADAKPGESDISSASVPSHGQVELLLAGYSYGSLILARLPTMLSIIHQLHSAVVGTAGAEIILRASALARQTKHSLEELHKPSSPRGRQLRPDDAATSPNKRMASSPIVFGGEETDPSARRRSRDERRSTDIFRKSVELPRRVKAHIGKSTAPTSTQANGQDAVTAVVPHTDDTPTVTTRYLAISPVLLPFTHTLAPPGPPSWVSLPSWRKTIATDARAGTLFSESPTLAIFGSKDGFTTSRRLKAWAQKLSNESKSGFKWHEIEGAGHFWREAGVMEALQKGIATWVNTS